jgi:hypothetical protein
MANLTPLGLTVSCPSQPESPHIAPMLAELAIHAFSPARLSFRRVGLHDKAVALWSRAARCQEEWAAHEARCHDMVRQAVASLPQRRKVLVLGSGLCRDFPLADLARDFERVVLVDAVHLWPVRVRLKRHPNVETRSRDLTGAVDWLIGRGGGRFSPLADFQADTQVDLVISANCLSQLPLGLDGWIDAEPARIARWGEDFADQAIGWHIGDLKGFACPVCLITDVEMVTRGVDGRETDRLDLMRGRWPSPPCDAEWEWLVAPHKETRAGLTHVHAVKAWRDVRPLLG